MSSTQNTTNGRGRLECSPVEFGDPNDIPPDAPAGEWQATCVSVVFKPTKKDRTPMLELTWRLDTALTDGNEGAEGQRVRDWVVFSGKKMSKIKYRALCTAGDIDPTVVSGRITGKDSLASLIEALDGLKMKLWTFNTTDEETDEVRTNVRYTAPRDSAEAMSETEEEPASERPAPRRAAAPANKNKRSARN